MKISDRILSKIRGIPTPIILLFCISIIIGYYLYNIFTHIITIDFNVYYYASKSFWSGDFLSLYDFVYYNENAAGLLFVYLPSFCILIPYVNFLTMNQAMIVFIISNMIFGCINVLILHKISLKFFKNQLEKVYIIDIIYALYIQHSYNASIAQRGDIGGFFILLIIYFELYDNKHKEIIQNISFTFLSALFIYMLLPYVMWLFYKKRLSNILIGIGIFIILNFPIFVYFFHMDQLINYIKLYISFEESLEATYAKEYSFIGALFIITKNTYFTLISFILITISTIWIYYRSDKMNFIVDIAKLSLYFLFFNILIHGLHILMLFPPILIYVIKKMDLEDLKLSELLGFLGILLIMFPIPHLFFEFLSIGQYSYLKRAISYLLFVPFLLSKSNTDSAEDTSDDFDKN